MRILFFDTFEYDKTSFEAARSSYPDIKIDYLEADLNPITAGLARGYDAVCGFVNSTINAMTLEVLSGLGVKLVLLRCAGFDSVNTAVAQELGMRVMRVPGYSPEAIAEHAMGLALAANRHIVKGYNRVRENDYGLTGLLGTTLHGKTAGIVGTGKIGAAMCRIVHGFGMRVLGYDVYQNPDLDFVEYVELDDLLAQSDLVSLHCPLFESNYHLIDEAAIARMKPGCIFVNTARGGLVDTNALVKGIRTGKIGACGLDVYEEEGPNVFKNRSSAIMESITSTLCAFPNVVVTSHQAFFTHEALDAIAHTTLSNAQAYAAGGELTGPTVVV
jgi:D-lactate dehydrogenase